MRIISGQLGGRTLRAPAGRSTRPTSDRTRESLFAHLESAILPDGLEGLYVVDLYAGSGALALEAISRGASAAACVDSSPDAVRVIEANVAALGLGGRVEVIRAPLPAALRRLRRLDAVDLFFIDPPYALADVPDLLTTIADLPVRPGVIAVWESDARNGQDVPDGWTLRSDRRAGDTRIRVVERTADAAR